MPKILGVEKKLVKLGKQKDCEAINAWIRSIVNHVYFSVISTGQDNPDLVVAKWLSLHNHICNKHSGHGKLFPKCLHPRLKKRDRQKAWLPKRKCSSFTTYHTSHIEQHIKCQASSLKHISSKCCK